MKKSLLTLLLAVALVSPVFAAEKGDMEADVKLGYTLSNSVEYNDVGEGTSGSTDNSFILGADFYYYVHPQVGLGIGINNIFDSTADYGFDDKYGFTNIYFAVKPKLDLQSDIFTSVYLIGQLGYGIFRFDYDPGPYPEPSFDTKNGLYWGIGAGAEIMKNFIFELIYSCNDAGVDFDEDSVYESVDVKYSVFSINLGYKFNF